MDATHLTNTVMEQAPSQSSLSVECSNELINSSSHEEVSQSQLAHSQLCSSCQFEKATIICSVCNEAPKVDNFVSTEQIAEVPQAADMQEIYFQKSISSADGTDNENKEEEAEQTQIDLDVLMRKGNMVYCKECFNDIHNAMSNTHIPIEIFQAEHIMDETNQSTLEMSETEIIQSPADLVIQDEEQKGSIIEALHPSSSSVEDAPKEASVIADLLNELVSISSSHLEQEERDQKILTKQHIQNQMSGLYDGLSNLNVRCEQFNDVKQSIRQMNDLIRHDLLMDFGVIATMIRQKLDEVTNNIKEKLKDAYSVVRDTQIKISNKLTEMKLLTDRIRMLEDLRTKKNSVGNESSISELPFSNFEAVPPSGALMTDEMIIEEINTAYERIDQINEDLKRISETSGYNANISASDSTSQISTSSLFVDNTLYPKFNYFVDTRKLVEAIQEIGVQIGSTDILNPKTYFLDTNEDSQELPQYSNNSSFYSSITSGISNEGCFWVQLNFKSDELTAHLTPTDSNNNTTTNNQRNNKNAKINMFIEEISKYIRLKRIGDKLWQSYAEANRVPEVNEKCFCLEPNTRKWLRAKVISYEMNVCKVRFMDTGYNHFESNSFTLDNLLIWQNFDLANYPARSIKCVLQKPDSELNYENNICLETKFHFKDTLANKNFKCELIEPVKEQGWEHMASDELTWIVKINSLSNAESPNMSINDSIINYNNQELLALENKTAGKNAFKSIDIRVESGIVGVVSQLVKTNCEQNKQNALVSTSSSFSGNKDQQNTDSDSTTKLHNSSESNYIGSSVINSFSDRIVEDAEAEKKAHEGNKITAMSLPNLPIGQTQDEAIVKIAKLESVIEPTILDNNNNETCVLKPEPCQQSNDSTLDEKQNLDIDDQTDERRHFKARHGVCRVDSNIDTNGIFWIRPLTQNKSNPNSTSHGNFRKLSKFIGDFLTKTQWKSFSELHIVPESNRKCFFRFRNEWSRGYIEEVRQDDCKVRDLDFGNLAIVSYESVYPHRRLTNTVSPCSNVQKSQEYKESFNIPKYLCIRCCISRDPLKLSRRDLSFFESILRNSSKTPYVKVFDLIEQITIGKQKCWFTALRETEFTKITANENYLSRVVRPMPLSKSNDVITTLNIKDDHEQSPALLESVSLQHQNFNCNSNSLTDQNVLLEQSLHTLNNLAKMGPSYLLPENFKNIQQLNLNGQQHQEGEDLQQPLHSMPPLKGNFIQKNDAKRDKRRKGAPRKTKDDLELDSSSHSERHKSHHNRRRRSRSLDTIKDKPQHNPEKDSSKASTSTDHHELQPNLNQNTETIDSTNHKKIDSQFISSMVSNIVKDNFMKSVEHFAVNKTIVDSDTLTSLPVKYATKYSKRNTRKSYPANNCKTDGKPKGCGRRHDRDDDDSSKRAYHRGQGREWSTRSGAGAFRESSERFQSQGNQGNQNNTGRGKQQQTDELYQASILNHFPNNHSDYRFISQPVPQTPYVINWTCDDTELNSSAFNEVFIEDNYCTTENDYDSKYGDDSEDDAVSETDCPKSHYDYYEDQIRFSEDHKLLSISSPSSELHSRICVTSLRDITNTTNMDTADGNYKSLGSKLTKSRCVYSIVHANKKENLLQCDEVYSLSNEEDSGDLVDVGVFDEVEQVRSSDVNMSNKQFCSEFLTKWNNNFMEKTDFDILAEDDESLFDKSDILMNNQNDVTTLDLTARHINGSPGLSAGEGESSATKCIRPQIFVGQTARQNIGVVNSTPLQLPKGNPNSSSSGSNGSLKKGAKTSMTPSSTNTTRGRTEDEENEFYISCAEEIRTNHESFNNNDDSIHTEKAFDVAHHIDHVNKSAQTDSSLFNKLEKLKQFTVAVFVDSIEDYSFEKNNNQSVNDSQSFVADSNIPTIHYNKTFSQSDLDEVFLSKTHLNTPTPSKIPNKNGNDYFKFSNCTQNEQDIIDLYKANTIEQEAFYNHEENNSASLKEFEKIESSQHTQHHQQNNYEMDPTLNIRSLPEVSDDAFIYSPSCNNYNILSKGVLTGKPPLGPNSSSPNNIHSLKTSPDQPPIMSLMYGPNHCLSTIDEASVELSYDTCKKSHSTSYDDDIDNLDNWTIDKCTFNEFNNVTVRRKNSRVKGEDFLDTSDRTIRESDLGESNTFRCSTNQQSHEGVQTLSEIGGHGDSVQTSIKITDKLFEKFCLISNDEIMQYSSMNSYKDSLEQPIEKSLEFSRTRSLSTGDKPDTPVRENKINTRLLNEILNAHVDEPASQSLDSMRLNVAKQPNEVKSANMQSIISSSSCSKLSSVNKQTVVVNNSPDSRAKNDSNNSTYGSLNNLNGINMKEQFNDAFEDEFIDDVFLNEKNEELNSLQHKSTRSSESEEINIDKKISSKSLNSINERKSFISNKHSSLPPSATTSEPSFPMLNASSTSTRSSSRLRDKLNASLKLRQNKNNTSTTTTLEISSYTSDSLFNSNFIVTPMCSEIISPLLYNNFLKSPTIMQGSSLHSPSLQPTHTFSNSCPNNLTNIGASLTPKSRTSPLATNTTEPLSKLAPAPPSASPSPPPPAKQKNFAPIRPTSNIFPSPPSLKCLGSTNSQSSLTESFPLPPVFVDNNVTKPADVMSANCPSDTNKSIQKPAAKKTKNKSTKSLIETITARLNLISDKDKLGTESAYGSIGGLFKSKKPQAPLAPSTPKLTDWSKQSEKSPEKLKSSHTESLVKTLTEQVTEQDVPVENSQSDLNKNQNSIDHVDAAKSNWKAANFSLYGLDTDDDEKSSVSKNQMQVNNFWQNKIDSELTEVKQSIQENGDEVSIDSLPLPPPPMGFDDNNNLIDTNKIPRTESTENYEKIDHYDLYEKIMKETEVLNRGSSQNLTQTSGSLPHPPSFLSQSAANGSFYTTMENSEIINEEPTKDTVPIMPNTQHVHSSSSSFNTVIQNIGKSQPKHQQSTTLPKSTTWKKQWKNLNCETLDVQQPLTFSLIPQNKMFEKQRQMMENHLNGKHGKQRIYANVMMNNSCPNILDFGEEQWYKNDEFIDEMTTITSEGIREFKLDQLLDINPKRLFKGSKFRCRIHDVIDENGKFWMEVIYSKEEERKFHEIFKLFSLCSKINQPPAKVHPKMRLSAFYKNDWHRAIVLNQPTNKPLNNNKVKVRFVDLGIVKNLDRVTELREIDQKFFNCPLKALQCTINLDRNTFDPEVLKNNSDNLKQFKFTRETRKFFTRIIYKRVLYSKVVGFTNEDANATLNVDNEEKQTVFQIVLGAQFPRGIIDIYMYLLSKYDRPYHDILKRIHNDQQKLKKAGIVSSEAYDESDTETSNLLTNTQTQSTIGSARPEAVLKPEIMQLLREEFIQCYGLRTELRDGDREIAISIEKPYENEESDFTEDANETTIEETEQPLFSNSYNQQDHRVHETITFSDSSSSESYFSVSDDDDEDEDDDDNGEDDENGDGDYDDFNELERTPVKGSTIDMIDMSKDSFCQKSDRSYNYSEPLMINSIHLPPIKNDYTETVNTSKVICFTEKSTVKVRDRKLPIKSNSEFDFTPILIPPGSCIKPMNKLFAKSTNNVNSDTDSSLVAPCCTGLHKFKWHSASKLKQKIISSTFSNKAKECPDLSIQPNFTQNSSINTKNKKVKFQVK